MHTHRQTRPDGGGVPCQHGHDTAPKTKISHLHGVGFTDTDRRGHKFGTQCVHEVKITTIYQHRRHKLGRILHAVNRAPQHNNRRGDDKNIRVRAANDLGLRKPIPTVQDTELTCKISLRIDPALLPMRPFTKPPDILIVPGLPVAPAQVSVA